MKAIVFFAGSLLLAAGCSKSDAGTTAGSTAPQPAALSVGLDAFKTRCAPCHGETGHGDGPASVALTPKPRNYTDGTWQKSVKDEDIKKTILYGGAAVGKSPIMPASPDLDGKPELDGLVAVVRSFGPK